MIIRKSIGFILGLMLAVFVASGTAKAVTIPFLLDDLDAAPFTGGNTLLGGSGIISAADFGVVAFASTSFDVVGTPSGRVSISNISGLLTGFSSLSYTITGTLSGLLFGGSFVDGDLIDSGGGNPSMVTLAFALGETIDILFFATGIIGTHGELQVKVSPVPLPAAGILFGGALAGIGFLSRRRRKKLNTPAVI